MNSNLIKEYISFNYGLNTMEDWLQWPPNTFAVTSNILMKSGAYRFLLSKKWHTKSSTRTKGWQQELETESQRWKRNVSDNIKISFDLNRKEREDKHEIVSDLKNTIASVIKVMAQKEITFLDIRGFDIENADNSSAHIVAFIEAILKIHCIADEACTSLGLAGQVTGTTSLYNYLANLLLVSTGTLTTFPKHLGIVLPKMRTPQTGLSIRSFSHHATYHETEVEVMWRMFPWANIQENTLNILSVCWPNEVKNAFFTATKETFQPIRFFRYTPENGKNNEVFKPLNIIKLMEGYREKGVDRIHMLVFPELSLSVEEWDSLLEHLAVFYRKMSSPPIQLPIVIAGVHRHRKKALQVTSDEAPVNTFTNELRIASFFSGKWYTMSQRKHHRWQLDGNQIQQYGLSGRLSTSRKWFEDIELGQRRLSVFSPNGWFTLCPLICEDLAQLEPVSSIIRGIGPTLLIALLADGPQLKARWSGRYASVFADDPGTSVLTVTSAGMVKKSTPRNKENNDSTTLALWKDQLTGATTIEDDDPECAGDCKNFLLTISADWVEEFTADGRTDHNNASVIKFQGITRLNSGNVKIDDADIDKLEREIDALKDWELAHKKKFYQDRDWNDIREISGSLAVIDALIETADATHVKLIDYLFDFYDKEDSLRFKAANSLNSTFYVDTLEKIYHSSTNPINAGIIAEDFNPEQKHQPEKGEYKWPTLSYRLVFIFFRKVFLEMVKQTKEDPSLTKYEHLFFIAKRELEMMNVTEDHQEEMEEIQKQLITSAPPIVIKDQPAFIDTFKRIKHAAMLQITFLIHNKLENNRRSEQPGGQVHINGFKEDRNELEEIPLKRMTKLFAEIEQLLIKNGY